MAPLQRLGSIETVIGFLWEVTFTFLVMRLAFVYAALALFSTALLACLAHAAVLPFLAAQQQVPPQALLDHVLGAANSSTKTAFLVLVSLIVVAVVGICSRFVMTWAQIPQLRRFRAAIGCMAATQVSLAWLALNYFYPSGCAGSGHMADHEQIHGHGHGQGNGIVGKTPTPTNPHMFTPTAGASMSMASFCQKSRVSIGCVHSSLNSISTCTIVGIVFVAAVALMPWVSMALLERPSRRYGHQRTASNADWTTPTKKITTRSMSSRLSLEEKAPMVDSYTSTSEDEEAEPRRAPKTRSQTGAKRYSLRTASERRSPRY
ncbi:hypothetical protein SBRCBS47491_006879 [Sporothrix bragantina]|uniref:Integral membrane protein n=1 Tax=Sporothrix bragantina TaxID=671064 RepID=A0ABP0CB59_9PEZI